MDHDSKDLSSGLRPGKTQSGLLSYGARTLYTKEWRKTRKINDAHKRKTNWDSFFVISHAYMFAVVEQTVLALFFVSLAVFSVKHCQTSDSQLISITLIILYNVPEKNTRNMKNAGEEKHTKL